MDSTQLRLEVFRELLQYHQLSVSDSEPTVNKIIEQTLEVSRAIEESVNTTPGGERS